MDQSLLVTPYGMPSPEAYVIQINNEMTSKVIGKQGENMRAVSYHSNCKVVTASNSYQTTDYSTGLSKCVRNVFIDGTYAQYMQSK